MKAVILAAGSSTRLGLGIPKALAKIDDKRSIIDLQIESIHKLLDVDEIIIVVGYKKELFMERYPDLTYAINEDYQNTSNAKSLLKGMENLKDDVLWINGDLVFDDTILENINHKKEENLIFVNNNPNESRDKEIKYSLDQEGHIKETSIDVENPEGDLIGLNYIKRKDLECLISGLKNCEKFDYFDRAIQYCIDHEVKFIPVDVEDKFHMEIDYPEELEFTRNYFSNKLNMN